ncbi:MAG TPA: hypothetical protein VN641_17200 [Urbifossiella sp.]|nr:hypothetical protein [Urbifossiella sp.]
MSLSADKIALADSVQLTLALEGPAPLRVDLPQKPEQLLAPMSAKVWSIRATGPAKITLLYGGRERWEARYRLSPFAPGEKVPIVFSPLKVTAGDDANASDVEFPSREVRVQTAITEPKADDARPVTGIEELPAVPAPQPQAAGWPFIAVLASIFAAVLVGAVIRRWRREPPPLPPGEWALRELGGIDPESGLLAADRLAAILREFIERRDGLSAPHLTTTELLAECAKADWSQERTAPLRELLERCDRAKFAGDIPDAAEMETLRSRAVAWMTPPAGL